MNGRAANASFPGDVGSGIHAIVVSCGEGVRGLLSLLDSNDISIIVAAFVTLFIYCRARHSTRNGLPVCEAAATVSYGVSPIAHRTLFVA